MVLLDFITQQFVIVALLKDFMVLAISCCSSSLDLQPSLILVFLVPSQLGPLLHSSFPLPQLFIQQKTLKFPSVAHKLTAMI